MFKKYVSGLCDDQSGTSLVEFGLIAPVLSFMVLGTMDIGHSYYVRSILDGAIQQAARSSALEGASTATAQQLIDIRVTDAVQTVAPNATITATRRYYKSFSEAARANAEVVIEDPSDSDLKCDFSKGENFMDANHNGRWDADGGSDGQGGAKDIVIIKFNISYPRMFPMAGLAGWSQNVELESNSILANQPYGEQAQYGPPTLTPCPDA